jgi:hypothetical protein
MNPAEENKNRSSGTTSATAARPSAPTQLAKPRTEAQYLAQQARDAADAITGTRREAVAYLSQAANPKIWVRAHPLISLGSGLIAGFAVGAARPIPWIGEQIRHLRAEFESLLHAAKGEHPAEEEHPSREADPKRETMAGRARVAAETAGVTGLVLSIVKELLVLARPILSGIVASQFAGSSSPHEHNGQSPPETADAKPTNG